MKTLALLSWTFFRLSFLCVGGGLSSIPEMQRQVISINGWLTARQFVDGYALSQVTPGPAMLVVTFVGFHVGGILGAFLATAAMFVPTSAITWLVAHHWARLRNRPWAAAVERSLPPVAIGLMAAGVYTVGKAAIVDSRTLALAVAAALVLAMRWLPPAVVVVAAGVVGWLAGL